MRKVLVLLPLLLLGTAFAQGEERIVATVNDDIQVTLDELQTEIRMLPPENQNIATTKEGVNQVLDGIIQRKLLANRASALEADTVAIVQEALKRSRESILADYLLISLRSTVEPATLDEAREFYAANESLFYTQPTVELKQIIAASKDEADKIEKALKSGKDFDKLMKDYPGIPGGTQSSDLGAIPLSQLAPNILEAIQALDAGEWDGPFQSGVGFYFLQVVSHQEPVKLEFDNISENLIMQLTNQRAQNAVFGYLQSLTDNAKITIDNAVLKDAILIPAPMDMPGGN